MFLDGQTSRHCNSSQARKTTISDYVDYGLCTDPVPQETGTVQDGH